jgi:hypothetical protein
LRYIVDYNLQLRLTSLPVPALGAGYTLYAAAAPLKKAHRLEPMMIAIQKSLLQVVVLPTLFSLLVMTAGSSTMSIELPRQATRT